MTYTDDSTQLILEPLFSIGDVVIHTRFQFRAVVVDVDGGFDHSDSSLKNELNAFDKDEQPDVNQPWYKLLIDNGEDLSYAPESMLNSDNYAQPVNHPMLKMYLTANIEEGRYISSKPIH